MHHAGTCGAGLSIFLLLSEAAILLVHDTWKAVYKSPYLDAYGEEDVGMQRGGKLTLNDERW